MTGTRLGAAGSASALILAAQAFRPPSLLRDALTGEAPAGASLEFPLGYTLASPFSALADFLSFNSARQHAVWAVWLLGAYWAARALARARAPREEAPAPRALRLAGGYLIYLLALLAFLAWGGLWPRSMARLTLSDPELLAVDFHSHTRHSWDGRSSFSPDANARWHRLAGFGAGFITDHNTRAGVDAAGIPAEESAAGGYRALAGEELSLDDAHVAVLGAAPPGDRKGYAGLAGLSRFLSDCAAGGGIPILSLPEYWKHQWGRLEELLRAGKQGGAIGIELVNASPKALDFPPDRRREAAALARRLGVFVCGVSDSHGWGRANFAWTVLRLPGHGRLAPKRLQSALLASLRADPQAPAVITRLKNSPAAGFSIVLDPPVGLWLLLRSLPPEQAGVCLLWIWVLGLWPRARRLAS